jgi:hypothetical protein
LLERLRWCFVRTQTWQHADRYASALVSEIPKRNGWTIAQQAGDRAPDRTKRLLNRAVWGGQGAMSQVRRFVVTGLDAVAGRGRRRGVRIAALDETGQQKAGTATCGMKRRSTWAARAGRYRFKRTTLVCVGADRDHFPAASPARAAASALR